MGDQDSPEPREDDHATRLGSPEAQRSLSGGDTARAAPRNDDRNEEVEGSPVPDPTEGDAVAEDVPEAD